MTEEGQKAATVVARIWRAYRYGNFAEDSPQAWAGRRIAEQWPELFAALDDLQRTWPD